MIQRIGSGFIRLFFALALMSPTLSAAETFTFNKGDHVCLIGNSLADRMQHDGWLETALQSQLVGKEIVIRNLGFCGDQVANRPRNQGFPSPETYLNMSNADVIFCFFGYNESYGGVAGLDKFKADLTGMINGYQGKQFNGKSAPRLVLFSPIAHENLKDDRLPDGVANNLRLAAYTKAMQEIAAEKKIFFVDLFAPSQELYAKAREPLTLNGVHLTDEGNRKLAEVIAKALLGVNVDASPKMEKLRQAVLDKNLHWYNRYRATDGNDVWGNRSGLKFNNQSNAQVLHRELEMLDVMTANRDTRIWAVASGVDLKVDDSNVPKPMPVVSNIGPGKRDAETPKGDPIPFLSGQDGISKMKIAAGFEVNLFASEEQFPELVNPVQMAVDPKGRLWVAAWKTYPKWEPGKVMDDRLLILPDENRDGKADKAITFARVHNPTGFEFWNGGVLVVSAPDILFLKDTDGDDVADVVVHYLQGIDSADTHHTENGVIYGTDGAMYMQRGIFNVNNVETPWSAARKMERGGLYRFDPRTFTYGFHASNDPNAHGTSQDYWGYMYATDGTGGHAFQVVMDNRGFKMRKLVNTNVRPVPASGVVSSAQFPPENQGNFLICNAIGFLGIKQYKLERNPDNGEVGGPETESLVVSSDSNFRPTDIEFGGDGALYFSDWQNPIIGHMQHNIRDPNRDHDHGRVYRMLASGRPLQEAVKIAGQPIPALLENLKHPIDGVRYRTRIELSGRPTKDVIDACQKWMAKFDPTKKEDAHHLLEALWLHQQHGIKNPKLLTTLLGSPEPHARNAAKVVQHLWYTVDLTGGDLAKGESEEKEVKQADDPAKGEFFIRTIQEKMAFSNTDITVKVGQQVKITLTNADFMPHNMVVVQDGSVQEVATAAMAMGADGFKVNFVPTSPKVVTATKLLEKGQTETITFTAPAQPGKLEFVCTFPGHWTLMRGIIHVQP